jgi:DNA-binding MarR family transcriptional regulator
MPKNLIDPFLRESKNPMINIVKRYERLFTYGTVLVAITIRNNEPMPISHLGYRTKLTYLYVTKIIQRLKKYKLLEVKKFDNRSKFAVLTSDGEKYVDIMSGMFDILLRMDKRDKEQTNLIKDGTSESKNKELQK